MSKKRRRYDRRREKKLAKKQVDLNQNKDDKNSSPTIRKRTKKLDDKKVQECLRKLDELEK